MEAWPRIRDLPEELRTTFQKWLGERSRPRLENTLEADQDAFYPWDYLAWCEVPDGHRLTSWLKIPFDDSSVDAAMVSVGAICLDKIHINRPSGIRLADYRLDRHIIELKRLENEPLDVSTRQQKLKEFVERHTLTGTARLTSEQNMEYWTRIVGIPVQRVVDDAAEQIQSTKDFLGESDLTGAILIVNAGADMIGPTSLLNLAKHFARRHSCIDAIMVLSLVPTIFEGCSKPVIVFYFEAFSPASVHIAERVEQALHAQLNIRFGKSLEVVELNVDAKPQVIRGPYEMKVGSLRIAIH